MTSNLLKSEFNACPSTPPPPRSSTYYKNCADVKFSTKSAFQLKKQNLKFLHAKFHPPLRSNQHVPKVEIKKFAYLRGEK